jgi:16S rRNA (cytosine1402-N4)-methyltransferase
MQPALLYPHVPVLNREVLAYLNPKNKGRYLDATLGAGGHAEAILKACQPDGELLGFDLDEEALSIAEDRLHSFSNRIHMFHRSYAQLEQTLLELGWDALDGALFDLGVSSMQVDKANRGFSFLKEGPLDMRFDASSPLTAQEVVNQWSQAELVSILHDYGEEPKAYAIARAICATRPLETTTQLAAVVMQVYHGRRGKIHPATRTFQAVRIAVNNELQTAESGIRAAASHLKDEGRIAVISFHSLEDRVVKEFFRQESKDCICPPEQPTCTCGHKATLKILTKKPVLASEDEIKIYPRSRSAKLRVAQKIG